MGYAKIRIFRGNKKEQVLDNLTEKMDKCPAVELGVLLGNLNVITKSRLSFLILITTPKMSNLSHIPLKPSCHPQHDMRDVVLKYAIAHLNK